MQLKKFDSIFILGDEKTKSWISESYKTNSSIIFLKDIDNLKVNKKNILITCNTGKIIKKKIFTSLNLAINIHGGSYDFPGRDAHHWACYYDSSTFGSTTHFISEKVDQGEIIDYEIKKIKKNTSPKEYREAAYSCSKELLLRIIKAIFSKNITYKRAHWSKKSFRRSALIKYCDFRGLQKEEIKKREHAFQGFEKFFNYK